MFGDMPSAELYGLRAAYFSHICDEQAAKKSVKNTMAEMLHTENLIRRRRLHKFTF